MWKPYINPSQGTRIFVRLLSPLPPLLPYLPLSVLEDLCVEAELDSVELGLADAQPPHRPHHGQGATHQNSNLPLPLSLCVCARVYACERVSE